MTTRVVLIVASVLTVATTSWSFEDTKPAAGGGILSGPSVKEEAAEGRQGFGEGDMMNDRPAQRKGPKVRAWFRVLQQLDLTSEQQSQVRPIAEEFNQLRVSFERENGDTLKEIEEALRKAKESGKGPESASNKELAQKAKAIRDKAPKPEPYMEKIWDLLTPDQQDDMKARLAEIEDRTPNPADKKPDMDQPKRSTMPENREGEPTAGPMDPMQQDSSPRRMRPRRDIDMKGLDETALKRVQFLREHRPGTQRPTARIPERSRFFEDDATEEGMTNESQS